MAESSNSENSLDLCFPKGGSPDGRPHFVSSYKDVQPAIACRELIQNALDAHAASSNNGVCEVNFNVETIKTTDIPGFASFCETVERCIKSAEKEDQEDQEDPDYQQEDDNPTIEYLQGLNKYADSEEVEVLFVTDNGAGFSPRTMGAVLSEGTPKKKKGSSGSFGVGHLTAFGLSNLQYILYGSKNSGGEFLVSGHAVLASHYDEDDNLLSPHGYLVKKYTGKRHPFKFYGPEQYSTCSFMKGRLDAIAGSGSVVAVLGFNRFGDEGSDNDSLDQIYKSILQTIAEDFAVAILSEKLKVTAGGKFILDKNQIRDILEEKEKPDKSHVSTNAKLTMESIKTYIEAVGMEKGRLPKPFQDCEVRLRNMVTENDVSIWRNGMLICRDFCKDGIEGKKPINAVVLLSGAEEPSVAHDLIRKAENPMHNKIVAKLLASARAKSDLKNFYKVLKEWLADKAIDSGDEQADLMDEIVLDAETREVAPRIRKVILDVRDEDDESQHAETEKQGPSGRTNDTDRQRNRENARSRQTESTRRKKKDLVLLQVQGRIDQSASTLHIRFKSSVELEECVLRLYIDGGIDESCDPSLLSEITRGKLYVNQASLDVEQPGNGCKLVEAKCGFVVLRDLQKNMPVDLNLKFEQSLRHLNQSAILCLLSRARKSKTK